MASDDRMRDYLTQIDSIVDTYGVMIQGVGGEPGSPGFSYTIGMGRVGHPEFIIIGVPYSTAGTILNDLAAYTFKAEHRFGHGDTILGLVQNFAVRLVEVTDPAEYLGMAYNYYAAASLPTPVQAYQVVFPDANAQWPWEEGCQMSLPVIGAAPTSSEGTTVAVNVDPN